MKSRVKLEVQKDATLQFVFDTKLYPLVRTSWEGLACWNYSPCIYAYKATDIAITGEGTIDGGGNMETWWPMCGHRRFNYKEGITKEAQSLGSRAKLLKQAEDGVDFDQRKFGLGQGSAPSAHQLRTQRAHPHPGSKAAQLAFLGHPGFLVSQAAFCHNVGPGCGESHAFGQDGIGKQHQSRKNSDKEEHKGKKPDYSLCR